ncbi:tetratricopeptide repeat protein [bacterium]|nr:tetratricopeptide repeat protein [bacterium]
MQSKKLKRRFKQFIIVIIFLLNFVLVSNATDVDQFNLNFNRGNEMFEKGKYEKALNYYHKALSKRPSSKEVLNNLGVVNKRLHLFKEAEKYYNKAIQVDKTYLNPHVNLCILYFDRNMFNKIIEISDNLLKYSPKNGVAYFGKGFGYYKRRDFHKAIRFLKLSLKYRGVHSDEYIEDAKVLLRKAKMKERYIWGGN